MLFRGAVEASRSPSVQTTLKKVVGLANLTYALWAAHVTQYIDNEIEEQERKRKKRNYLPFMHKWQKHNLKTK